MAFDEEGQAATEAEKVASAAERTSCWWNRWASTPKDIIFDPNILTIGTGIGGAQQLRCRLYQRHPRIKHELCPGCKISGGVSNLAFSFRATTRCAEAFHSAFLYHACKAGMDMGIVNAAQVEEDVYREDRQELLEYVEDVLLNRRHGRDRAHARVGPPLIPSPAHRAPKKGAEVAPALPRRMTPRRGATSPSASASSTRSSRASTSSASPTPPSAAPTATTRPRWRSSRVPSWTA